MRKDGVLSLVTLDHRLTVYDRTSISVVRPKVVQLRVSSAVFGNTNMKVSVKMLSGNYRRSYVSLKVSNVQMCPQ